MLFDAETREDRPVIRPRQQRPDAAIAHLFRDEVFELLGRGSRRVLIDLSEVEFLGSSGLGALVANMRRIGDRGNLAITGLSRSVHKVFELTRMVQVFTIRSTASGILRPAS